MVYIHRAHHWVALAMYPVGIKSGLQEVLVCDKGWQYYVAVCMVLYISEVFGVGQVELASD